MAEKTDKDPKTEKVEAPEIKDPPKLDEANTQYQREKLMAGMGWMDDPEKKLPPLTEEQKDTEEGKEAEQTDEEKAATTAADKKKKDADKKKTLSAASKAALHKKTPEPVEDADERAERVAEKIGTKIAEKLIPKPSAPPAEPAMDWLSAEDKRDLEALEWLEKDDPEFKGKGLAAQAKKFWEKEKKYAETWEKDNPGEVYNPKAQLHQDWYEKNSHEYLNDSVLQHARVEMAAERRAEKKFQTHKTESSREIEQLRTERRMDREAPDIARIAYQAEKSMFNMAVPELAKTLAGVTDEDDEEAANAKLAKLELDAETVGKIKEEDPATHKILAEASNKLKSMSIEIENLIRYPSAYKFRPDFLPHAEVQSFANNLAAQLEELGPEAKRESDGKLYLSQAAWSDRLERISKSNASAADKERTYEAFNARYFTMTSDVIIHSLAAHIAAEAAAKISEMNQLADLRMNKKGARTDIGTPAQNGEKRGVFKERSAPPNTASASDKLDTSRKNTLTDEERVAQMEAHY